MGPTVTLTVGVVASSLLAAVVLVLVARQRSRGERWRALAAVTAAVAVLGLGSLVTYSVVRPGLHSPLFALIHAAYLALVIGIPTLGVALGLALAAGLLPRRRHLLALGLSMVLWAPIGWYGTHVAPFWLKVERVEVEVPDERAGNDSVRIAVLADLQSNQVGPYEHRVVDRLLAEKPDLILLTGDWFQGDDVQFAATRAEMTALLGRLKAPGGVFAVRGDVDQGDKLDLLVEGTGVRILDNEIAHVEVGDRRLAVLGNWLLWAGVPAVAGRDELRRTPSDEIRVAFAHRPDVAFGFPTDGDVDLVVAGHTHGGQVALPILGPPEDFSNVPRSVGAGGLHSMNGNPIYVSVGVGMERIQAPQVRLGTRPTIGIVTLR